MEVNPFTQQIDRAMSRIEVQFQVLKNFVSVIFVSVILFPLIPIIYPLVLGTDFYGTSTLLPLFDGIVLEALPIFLISLWLFLDEPRYFRQKYHLQEWDQPPSAIEIEVRNWISEVTRKQVTVLRIPDESIRAFAFGTFRSSFLAISEGALQRLDQTQLQALIFHEVSHIDNGDLWKTKLARSVTLVSVLVYLLPEILGIATNLQTSADSGTLPFTIFVLSIIPFVIMLFGVLEMIRISELVADQFAIVNIGGSGAFVQLFMRQIDHQNGSRPAFLSRWHIPAWLRNHPSIDTRLKIITHPELMVSEAFFLAAYSGLVLSIIVGNVGDIQTSVLFMVPVLLIFGIFAIFLLDDFIVAMKYKNWGRLFLNLRLAFTLTSTSAITVALETLIWSFVQKSAPLGLALHGTVYMRTYQVSPILLQTENLWTITDMLIIVAFLMLPPLFIVLLTRSALGQLVNTRSMQFFRLRHSFLSWVLFLPFLAILSYLWYSVIKANPIPLLAWIAALVTWGIGSTVNFLITRQMSHSQLLDPVLPEA